MDRLLLALDGSDRAFETVRYVSTLPGKREIVLFSVFSQIPKDYWDLGDRANLAQRVSQINAWITANKNLLTDHLREAKDYLVKKGLSPDQVRTVIQNKEKGIITDILAECKKGYKALFIGRKGVSKLTELVMGSVATKLLEKERYIPLVLVGRGCSEAGNVMVAVDGSKNSFKAIDVVGDIFKGHDKRFMLLHVVKRQDKEFLKDVESMMEIFFSQALANLEKKGIKKDQIETRLVSNVESRSGTIVDTARKENFNTIFVGRKGMSRIGEFFMGRVSNKVVQLAKGLAVWVIS